jgi:uncharacterized damage-inducible protein DinB
MTKKENLMVLLKSNHAAVRKLIDDVDDIESMVCGKDNRNHIRWLTGHLVYNAGNILKVLGAENAVSEKWLKLFCKESEISDNPNNYPSMAELKNKLYSLYVQIYKTLNKMTDSDLDKNIEPFPKWQTTPMDALLFLCTHEFYHAGQITNMLRILGRERPFG